MPLITTTGGGSVRGLGRGKEKADVIPGEALFINTNIHNWTVPEDVTSVCVLAIGGGGGGSRFQTTEFRIPTSGGTSYFINTSTVAGFGGKKGGSYSFSTAGVGSLANNGNGAGGGFVGQGGGRGGHSWNGVNNDFSGGGGAGGYTGQGGDAGKGDGSGFNQIAGGDGQGGGGGGAGGWGSGGGVGVYGQGANGAGMPIGDGFNFPVAQGGSGGTSGDFAKQSGGSGGGLYGGGGGGTYAVQGGGGGLGWVNNIGVIPGQTYVVFVGAGGIFGGFNANFAGDGGSGAVRILWGNNRQFPSLNVDLSSSTDGQTIY